VLLQMNKLVTAIAITLASVTAGSSARADDSEACAAAATEADRLRRDATALRAATKHLTVCAADACPEAIRDDCRAWRREVDEQIPTVVLVADDGGSTQLSDVRVSIAGTTVAETLDGVPIALDAGTHTVTFERAGRAPVEVQVVLVAGQKNVEVRAHIPSPEAAAPPPPRRPAEPPPPTLPTPREDPPSPLRTAGLGFVTLGLVGVGVGAIFGLNAMAHRDDSGCVDNRCGPGSDPEALRAAGENADYATGFFIAGGAFVAAGAVLFLIAPSDRHAGVWLAPKVGATGGRLGLGGAW
jgi:hypothetical protein